MQTNEGGATEIPASGYQLAPEMCALWQCSALQ